MAVKSFITLGPEHTPTPKNPSTLAVCVKSFILRPTFFDFYGGSCPAKKSSNFVLVLQQLYLVSRLRSLWAELLSLRLDTSVHDPVASKEKQVELESKLSRGLFREY
jgi:hypothetical protein